MIVIARVVAAIFLVASLGQVALANADAGNVVAAFSFADKAYAGCQLGVPSCGTWQVRLNSDATAYGSDFGTVGATSVSA